MAMLEPMELLSKSGFCSGEFHATGIDAPPPSFPSSPQSVLDILGRFEVTPSGSLAVGIASDFDVSLNQSLSQDGPAISGFLREALERHSRFVSFDDVIKVRNFNSACHVYDLQSDYGLVVASDPDYSTLGVVTSNCQCSFITEFGMTDEEATQLIQEHQERLRDEE
jgi:hypothetical protein